MTNSLYMAIDQGGHSSRALVFNADGKVVAQAKYNVKVNTPKPGWAEQDAEELVYSIEQVVEEVLEKLASRAKYIVAAGLATQRSNVVCWEKQSGKAISSAISWQDRRAHKWLSGFAKEAKDIHARTGLLLTAHYGASKLRWCLDNLADVKRAWELNELAWGPMASFLVYRITKERHNLVDPANASRTLLWNLEQRDWDPHLLQLFGVPQAPLPTCVPTRYQYGALSNSRLQDIPLTIVNGDQSAALYAYGIPDPDTAYINMGTGAFLQIPTLDQVVSVPKLLSSIVLHDHDHVVRYVLECTVNGAGSALTKIEDELGIRYDLAEARFTEWLNQSKNPPIFLNGVSGLGAPYWIPDFESKFIGSGSDWEKIVAVAESIIFLLTVNLQLTQSVLPTSLKKILLTGGLALSDGLCQRLADLSGLPVDRPQECEATARGTAFLVASCPGHWHEHDTSRIFQPQDNPALQNRFNNWFEQMELALKNYACTA